MNGWDTLSAIVSEGLLDRNVVCLLTALHEGGPKANKLRPYVLDCVKKPFTPERLLSVVDRALACAAGLAQAAS